jgi:hypothetical protein
MTTDRKLAVSLKGTLIASVKLPDGLMVPVTREDVTGMDEAIRKMPLMYAAGADRVSLMLDFVLDPEDVKLLREEAKAAYAKAHPESANEEPTEKGGEPKASNVIDLATVRARGNA